MLRLAHSTRLYVRAPVLPTPAVRCFADEPGKQQPWERDPAGQEHEGTRGPSIYEKAADTVSHLKDKAKEALGGTVERIKYDEDKAETFVREKANEAAERAAERGEQVAESASAANERKVKAATGGNNPETGERGPYVEGRSSEPDPPLREDHKPVNEKGPHLRVDPEGQQSSST